MIWSSWSVASCDDGSSADSHDPQLSEMIVRCSVLRRASIESSMPAIVPELGATYVQMLSRPGASPSSTSWSSATSSPPAVLEFPPLTGTRFTGTVVP